MLVHKWRQFLIHMIVDHHTDIEIQLCEERALLGHGDWALTLLKKLVRSSSVVELLWSAQVVVVVLGATKEQSILVLLRHVLPAEGIESDQP